MPERALSDVKVLDPTRYIAGPYCTKLLADYGADVIKVEKPGTGDPARSMGPFLGDVPHPEQSGLFLYLNTNKRSITLNLKTETGRRLFKELVKDSDILVESFKPGVMEGLGLGYEALEKVNPKLVMASISNFGQTGPYRDHKASHLIEGAIGGWSCVTGDPEREPLQAAGCLTHFAAGLAAATGTLSALYYQRETGQGQYMDLSMMEAAIHITTTITSYYTHQGLVRNRTGNVMLQGLGFVARCRDGYLGVNAYTVPQWETLFRWVGMHDIVTDPRLQTREGRTEHAREITERLKLYFKDKSAEESFYGAQAERLPFALVPTAEELLTSPQLKAREYFVEAEHATTGRVAYPGAPFKMAETSWVIRRPAPLLGQHNQEILGQRLGYSREELTRLRETRVI